MFKVILLSHWKWSRLMILLGAVAGFALPILSVQGAAAAGPRLRAGELVRMVEAWGVLYPVLAAGLGLLVAVAAWASDHRGRHVHALTLPVSRPRYVLLRYASGVVLLALPFAAVSAGALLATAAAVLPPGLHGYPVALSLRFALAVLVAYSLFFAVSSGTARTAGIILGTLGVLIAVEVVAGAAGANLPLLDDLFAGMLQGAGPLGVFSGRWMLVDV